MHVCSCVSTHVEARGQPRVSSQRQDLSLAWNSPITLDQPAIESQGCVCVGGLFQRWDYKPRSALPVVLKGGFCDVNLAPPACKANVLRSKPSSPLPHGVRVFKATWLKFHEHGSSFVHTSVQRTWEESADKKRPQIQVLPLCVRWDFLGFWEIHFQERGWVR